jgi:hypothetical protein
VYLAVVFSFGCTKEHGEGSEARWVCRELIRGKTGLVKIIRTLSRFS